MSSIGPQLPPGWKPEPSEEAINEDDGGESNKSNDEESCHSAVEEESTDEYGPALPPELADPDDSLDHEEEEQEDIQVGPMPTSSESSADYEHRLQSLRHIKAVEESSNQRKRAREEWMTELPSKISKSFGLSARTFKKHDSAANADASAWTETPEERRLHPQQREKLDEACLVKRAANERDKKFDAEVAVHNEKRSKESLIDLHSKKKQHEIEEMAKKGDKTERRAFDREKDLKIVNLRSASDRKSMIDKARQFSSRFDHGSDQKYL